MLQAIYEAVDCADLGAQVFFADFWKGFDLIDHNILMTELRKLEVDPALISWIAAFLTDRQQAVRIGATLSDWKFLKGGVPQGTKLGVILFTIMTKNLFLLLPQDSWDVCSNTVLCLWRRGGLMVSVLHSGSGGLGLSPGQGHCVVFLGKTLYSHSASLHPGVQMGTNKCAEGNPAME